MMGDRTLIPAGELKWIYDRRVAAFDAGAVHSDPELVESARDMLARLQDVDDAALVSMEMEPANVTFTLVTNSSVIGKLPLAPAPTTPREGLERVLSALLVANEYGHASLVSSALASGEDGLQCFLASDDLWGGSGSIADQAGSGIARGVERRRIESALIDLGRMQLAAGVSGSRTATWVETFLMWRESGI